jgi:hypothetical protein
MVDDISIPTAIRELLQIVNRLHAAYPEKSFTLDGRLVGDLGEVLAAQAYEITLHQGLHKYHDAVDSAGRQVQIKATMQDILTFPGDNVPDYYLGIKMHSDGSFDEVFNGPGKIASLAVKNRKTTKYNLHSISIKALEALDQQVKKEDRIQRRLGH